MANYSWFGNLSIEKFQLNFKKEFCKIGAIKDDVFVAHITLGKIKNVKVDNDVDKISDIADKIRNSFDYIIRKKYVFETKFYESDNDAVWFLWGFISLLYQDQDFDMIYSLFNNGYSKKTKSSRIGLLWVAALLMVYIKKKDIARTWIFFGVGYVGGTPYSYLKPIHSAT